MDASPAAAMLPIGDANDQPAAGDDTHTYMAVDIAAAEYTAMTGMSQHLQCGTPCPLPRITCLADPTTVAAVFKACER
jgi:hypothetical protein